MADFLQTLITAITIGSLYALIALGYTMVYGILQLINFAHADIVVLGAWSSLTVATFLLPRLGVSENTSPWWAALLVLTVAMIVCGVVGLAIERFAYKPLRSAPRLNVLITAMGVSLLLQNVGQLQYTVIDGATPIAHGQIAGRPDPRHLTLDQPISLDASAQYILRITPAGQSSPIEREINLAPGQPEKGQAVAIADPIGRTQAQNASYTLVKQSTALKLPFGKMPDRVPNVLPTVRAGNVLYEHKFESQQRQPDGTMRSLTKPLDLRLVQVVIVVSAVALMLALEVLIYHTRFGIAMRAVSFNTEYAALMGIPIDRVISITFIIGSVLAATAGFLYGQMYNQLQQTAHTTWTMLGLKAFVAAVVGGIGNVRGAVVGGFLIAFIEHFGGLYGTALWPNASAYTDVAVFLLLILVLLVKPSGLFGSTVREKV